MRKTFTILSLLAAAHFMCMPIAAAKPPELRKVTVGVAVTPEFQKDPEWKTKFKKRLRYTSKIFEREFRIKIANAVFFTWDLPADQTGSRDEIDHLMREFPLESKKVDLIIGLTKLENVAEADNVRDLHVLGLTRPFSGFVLLRYPNSPLFKIQEESILTHELGHLFGATHTKERDTIMYPYVGKHIPTAFDSTNRKIISSVRDMDFRDGTRALNAGVVQNLVNSYRNVNIDQQPPEFFYSLATFYLRLGERQKALDAFKQLKDLEPDNGRVLYNLGILHFYAGNFSEARRELLEALNNLNREYDQDIRAKTLNLLGKIYFRENNLEGALRNWRQALEVNPDDWDIRVNIAIVQIKTGQVAAAEPVLRKALRAKPNDLKIIGYLGVASYMRNNYTDALSYFNEALRITQKKDYKSDPGMDQNYMMAEIYSGMGSSYWGLNRRDEAARYFSMACEVDPSTGCDQRLGQIYYQLGEWDAAIAKFVEVIKTDKENPDVYGMLGVALTKKGDVENAIGVFSEGQRVAQDPVKAARLHSNTGNLYMQLQNAEMAVQEFMQAISKDWNNREAHLGLGMGYLIKGQPNDAKGALRNLLSLDPGNPRAKELMQKADMMIEEMRKQQQQSQQINITFAPPGS